MADAPRLVTGWASRERRLPEALAPGHVGVDERGVAETLAETAHFARFVRFVGPDEREEGDWEPLVACHPSVALALIGTLDLDGARAEVETLVGDVRCAVGPAEAGEALRRLVALLVSLSARLERWSGSGGDAADLLGPFAEAAATRLASRLRALLGLAAAAEQAGLVRDALPEGTSHLAARWMIGEIAALEREAVAARLEGLAGEVDALLDTLAELGGAARGALAASLERPDHPPQLALIATFADLLGRARTRINALPLRIADFYHREMIGAEPRPGAPDRVLLVATHRADTAPPPTIAAGTLFKAGRDGAGRPIAFAAEAELPLTGAEPKRLRLWRPGPEGMTAAETKAAEDGGVAFDPAAMAPVRSGILIAAPLLALGEGKRRVTLRLRLDGAPPAAEAMALAFSTAAGWVEAEGVEACTDGDEAALSFRLAPDAPAIAAGPLELPALRLLLRAPCAARLIAARIEVAVKRLTPTLVATVHGATGPGGEAFGPAPAAGAWLDIGHPALARGTLDRLVLGLGWAAPPPDPAGFAGHYAAWRVGPDRQILPPDALLATNDSFQVTLAPPIGAAGSAPLFPAAAPPDMFAADFVPALAEAVHGPAPVASWFAWRRERLGGPPGAGGRIRLTLAAPAFGFGDSLYPVNAAFAAVEAAEEAAEDVSGSTRRRRRRNRVAEALRAPFKWLTPPPKNPWEEGPPAPGPAPTPPPPVFDDAAVPIANPPWRALLSGVRIDFAAHDSAPLLYRPHPFDPPRAIALADRPALAPPLAGGTAVDLELTGWTQGRPLSLLLRLAPGAADPVAPSWQWRTSESGWRPIEPVADGTGGLAASGLVLFDPGERPPGPVWLRACLAAPEAAPRLTGLFADAFAARRCSAAPDDTPLPAGTIAQKGARGLAIAQPLPSSGGRPAEDEAALHAATAERLRHRGRAVTAWDMERIALDAFPELARVRAVAAKAGDGPGRVTLLAIPGPGAADGIEGEMPCASPALRRAIAAALQAKAPPFADIHVAAPAFVPVDIVIAAEFDGAEEAGQARLEEAIAAFLSPWGSEGPDLPEDDGWNALAPALADFARQVPGVRHVARVSANRRSFPEGAVWVTPAIGTVSIAALEAER